MKSEVRSEEGKSLAAVPLLFAGSFGRNGCGDMAGCEFTGYRHPPPPLWDISFAAAPHTVAAAGRLLCRDIHTGLRPDPAGDAAAGLSFQRKRVPAVRENGDRAGAGIHRGAGGLPAARLFSGL